MLNNNNNYNNNDDDDDNDKNKLYLEIRSRGTSKASLEWQKTEVMEKRW